MLLWEDFSYLEGTQDSDYLGVVPCPIRCLIENPSFTITSNDCYHLKDCYWVVGSCNGLVCLLGNHIGDEFSDFWLRFWNPATMLSSEKLAAFRVERGNRLGSPSFAFGYDNLNDTYKVVAYCLDTEAVEDSQKTQVKVCSLGDNCWRNIESFPVVPIAVHRVGDKDGVFVSGTLNWLAISNFPAVYDWSDITIDQLVIVSFDLGKERCTKLALPLGFDGIPNVEPNIGVLMDCLCFSHDYKRSHFVVWQMKEFGVEKSWTQLVNVSYHNLRIQCLEDDFMLLPLFASKNDCVLIIGIDYELQAILYNWRDNRVQRTEMPKNICWAYAKYYVESLVSPCCK